MSTSALAARLTKRRYFRNALYDANGNVVSKRLPNYETITTGYDALNRREVINAPAYSYLQSYDLAGNLVQVRGVPFKS